MNTEARFRKSVKRFVLCTTLSTILAGGIARAQESIEAEIEAARAELEAFEASIEKLRPVTRDSAHTLRVVRVTDPRLMDLNDDQYDSLYAQIERDTRKYLAYDVNLVEVEQVDILTFFQRYEDSIYEPRFTYRYFMLHLDLDHPEDRDRLRNGIVHQVREDSSFAVRLVPGKSETTVREIADTIFNQFMERYAALRRVRTRDGTLFAQVPYEMTQYYTVWTLVQHLTRKADIFITNSVIAEADVTMPVGVAARGGITAGVTSNNIHNVYQGTVAVGLLPFLSNHPPFEPGIPADDLIPTISMLFVHELGHLLCRYADYTDLKHSVHARAPDLDFHSWYLDIVDNQAEVPDEWRILETFY